MHASKHSRHFTKTLKARLGEPAAQIDELKVVREQLVLKYGKEFAAPAVRGEGEGCRVNGKVKSRLTIGPPDWPSQLDLLVRVAEEFQVPFNPAEDLRNLDLGLPLDYGAHTAAGAGAEPSAASGGAGGGHGGDGTPHGGQRASVISPASGGSAPSGPGASDAAGMGVPIAQPIMYFDTRTGQPLHPGGPQPQLPGGGAVPMVPVPGGGFVPMQFPSPLPGYPAPVVATPGYAFPWSGGQPGMPMPMPAPAADDDYPRKPNQGGGGGGGGGSGGGLPAPGYPAGGAAAASGPTAAAAAANSAASAAGSAGVSVIQVPAGATVQVVPVEQLAQYVGSDVARIVQQRPGNLSSPSAVDPPAPAVRRFEAGPTAGDAASPGTRASADALAAAGSERASFSPQRATGDSAADPAAAGAQRSTTGGDAPQYEDLVARFRTLNQ